MAKRTLYNNFDGKDELVAAYLLDRDERWRASLKEITDQYEGPEDRLLAAFVAYGERFVDDVYRGCAFINAASEIAKPNHPAREAEFEDPDILAEKLLLLLEGATVTALMRESHEPLNVAQSMARELIRAK